MSFDRFSKTCNFAVWTCCNHVCDYVYVVCYVLCAKEKIYEGKYRILGGVLMEPRTKQNLMVTVIGVSLFVALMNLGTVLSYLGKVVSIVMPVIVGGILALFIHVPMKGIENRLLKLFERKKKCPSATAIRVLSFILTMLAVVLVIVLVVTLVGPEIVRSSKSLYDQIEASIPQWITYMNSHNINAAWLEELTADINMEQTLQNFSTQIDSMVTNVVGALSSTVQGVITAGFAFIIAIYLSLDGKRVRRHATKLITAYLKPTWSARILHVCRTFRRIFGNFLTGQCTEAVILGILMCITFSIFKLPYGSLVGVLTAVCAIIPYVGAFISSAVSIFLTLLVDPSLVIRCLIVYSVTQFVENQVIYPRVVGGSVGLPPLYTLIAAMIGGKLFGIIGIIFFIPLAAVAVELVKADAAKRLHCNENILHNRRYL